MTVTRSVAAPVSDAPGVAGATRGPARSVFGIGQPGVWLMVGSFFIIDLIWSARIGLSIGGWASAGGLTCLLLAVSAAYRQRSARIADMAETGALWLAFTPSACVPTYLAATCAWPLQDAMFWKLDHAIGFDWLAWRNTMLARPVLHAVLGLAYASLLPQMALSALFFAATDRTARSVELLLLAGLALVPTLLVSTLWPAVGPFGTYGGREATFMPDLLALRAGGPWRFELPALQGIITMPSYHVALAALFSYAFRRTGPVGWGITGLNALMLPAIAPVGGHYLVDMIAGGVIAVVCILGWRRWQTAGRSVCTA